MYMIWIIDGLVALNDISIIYVVLYCIIGLFKLNIFNNITLIWISLFVIITFPSKEIMYLYLLDNVDKYHLNSHHVDILIRFIDTKNGI